MQDVIKKNLNLKTSLVITQFVAHLPRQAQIQLANINF